MPDLPRLADIGERIEEATEGPWEFSPGFVSDDGAECAPSRVWAEYELARGISGADAEFIAHARTDVPAMHAALTAVLALIPRANPELIEAGYGVSSADLLAAIETFIEIGGE